MKTKISLILILALVACHPGSISPQDATLNALNKFRDYYATGQKVLASLHTQGVISDTDWASKVLPVDTKVSNALKAGYDALSAWVALTGSSTDVATKLAAVFAAVADFQNLIASFQGGHAMLEQMPVIHVDAIPARLSVAR